MQLPTNKKCHNICCLTENIAVTNTSAQELLGGSGSGAIDISVNISVLEGMLKYLLKWYNMNDGIYQ